MSEDGVGEVVDFMPVVEGPTASDNHRLVRLVRCVRGQMSFDIDIAPRFDYGRLRHQTTLHESGAVFRADGVTLTLHTVRNPGDEHLATSRRWRPGRPRSRGAVRAGRSEASCWSLRPPLPRGR